MLVGSVVVVLGALFVNKYYGFFAESVDGLVGGLAAPLLPRLDLAAAAGLSFYSFSWVSYLADVYAGESAGGAALRTVRALYGVLPQAAGGTARTRQTVPVAGSSPGAFSSAGVTAGLQLMLWGLFKKVVIADRLAPFVDAAYRQPAFASPADLVHRHLLLCVPAVLRLLRLLGHRHRRGEGAGLRLDGELPPAVSRDHRVREFWASRWHLSLSAWFRDYLYIPLGGSRVSRSAGIVN